MVNLKEKDLKDVDFSDSQALFQFSIATVQAAKDYQDARVDYAQAKLDMDALIGRRLSDGRIDPRCAYEKALVMVYQESQDNYQVYRKMVISMQTYKGLEKVLDARQSVISLHQSLIKNQTRNA